MRTNCGNRILPWPLPRRLEHQTRLTRDLERGEWRFVVGWKPRLTTNLKGLIARSNEQMCEETLILRKGTAMVVVREAGEHGRWRQDTCYLMTVSALSINAASRIK